GSPTCPRARARMAAATARACAGLMGREVCSASASRAAYAAGSSASSVSIVGVRSARAVPVVPRAGGGLDWTSDREGMESVGGGAGGGRGVRGGGERRGVCRGRGGEFGLDRGCPVGECGPGRAARGRGTGLDIGHGGHGTLGGRGAPTRRGVAPLVWGRGAPT